MLQIISKTLVKLKISSRFYIFILISVMLHTMFLYAAMFFINLRFEKAKVNHGFVEMKLLKTESTQSEISEEPEKKTEQPEEDNSQIDKEEKSTAANYINFTDINADTTSLEQLYTEPTLSVKIKYPAGWTFVDQNNKNKLDGVTFWSLTNEFDPPPYIHLEVKEKYLFSKSRYSYKKEFNNFTAYYNDPEELEGQVTQTIYIVTEDDYDFSIKLIMEGREEFMKFQPRFFGMIKSFRFGDLLF